MNEDIVRIAAAMGFRQHHSGESLWSRPQDMPHEYSSFNPLISYDDCHALIEWLNGRGWLVELVLNGEFAEVRFVWTKDSTIQHVAEFVPYREGLVKLTLKILDESDE